MASEKRIEAAGANQEDEILARLVDAGERLVESDGGAILRRGSEVVPALLGILEDGELARVDAPGHGYAPVHAAKLLQQLGATDTIAPMLRVLARCDPRKRREQAEEEAPEAEAEGAATEPEMSLHRAKLRS